MISPDRPRLPTPPFFFFNDTATTEIYTLSLHDALPISPPLGRLGGLDAGLDRLQSLESDRSEEHTSELQSPDHLVCRLLLEKKQSPIAITCSVKAGRTSCCTHRRPKWA